MAIVTPVEDAAGPRRRLRLASPATLEPIDEIEVATADDVRNALDAARKAQPAWAALSVRERARFLRRALPALLARQSEFVDVIVRESGKPRSEALMMEIFAGADALAFYARRAERFLRAEKRKLHGVLRFTKKLRVAWRPLGVVGVICPWNGPFILALNPTIQALVAGNAVLLKPSEVTPRSSALVAELFEAAGLPAGLVQVLHGDGETGAALVNAGLDKIAFTGSVATGRRVARACAEQLVPCVLELGGKDPMIVCADADLDRAAAGAVAGAFLNTGQFCCGTERVYVVEGVADEFQRKVLERVAALRQGDCGEFDVGPLFWDRQLEIVEQQVGEAVARGARVLAGGRRNPELRGLYYEPTVLVDVTPDMAVMCDETFGPVLPIVRVRDEDEALALANQSRYALAANVWSRDAHRAEELAARLETGSVCVNDISMTYGVQEAPFGGRKQSGIGQVNGEAGVRGFAFAQPVVIDRFGGRAVTGHYPYTRKKELGLERAVRWLHGSLLRRFFS
jgi:succinate-semialdehyde dehydrogenase/glutarate-semialdehyde dehydrogenase